MRCYSSSHTGWPGSIIEQLKIIGPLTDPGRRLRSCSAFPGTVPPEVAKALQSGGPPPSGLSEDEARLTSN